jgi:hypothetical protein
MVAACSVIAHLLARHWLLSALQSLVSTLTAVMQQLPRLMLDMQTYLSTNTTLSADLHHASRIKEFNFPHDVELKH